MTDTNSDIWRCPCCTFDNCIEILSCEICGSNRLIEDKSNSKLKRRRLSKTGIKFILDDSYENFDNMSDPSDQQDIHSNNNSNTNNDDSDNDLIDFTLDEDEEVNSDLGETYVDSDKWIEIQSQVLGTIQQRKGNSTPMLDSNLDQKVRRYPCYFPSLTFDLTTNDSEEDTGDIRFSDRAKKPPSPSLSSYVQNKENLYAFQSLKNCFNSTSEYVDDIEDFDDVLSTSTKSFPESIFKNFICVKDLKRDQHIHRCSIDFHKFMMDSQSPVDLQYDKRKAARENKESKKKSAKQTKRSASSNKSGAAKPWFKGKNKYYKKKS